MKREYEARINKMLHVYHLSNQHGAPSGGYSINVLHHSLHHLCAVAMCSDDADTETIVEIRSFIDRVSKGDVPQHYDHPGINQFSSTDGSKTLCVKGPLAVSIELTPENIKSLRNAIGGQECKSHPARTEELIEHFGRLDFDNFKSDQKHLMDIITFRLKSYISPPLGYDNANICSHIVSHVIEVAKMVYSIKEKSELQALTTDDYLYINRAIAGLAVTLRRELSNYKPDSISE